MASLLDRYDEIQRRPFGTNTALSNGNQNGVGGSAGNQFRSQNSAYGQALRILNRQARRGDARSALSAIAVRNQANAEGYSPGGITNVAEQDAGVQGRIGALETAAQAREQAITEAAPEGSSLLTRRQALYDRMQRGEAPNARQEAADLGVTPSGFARAESRILNRQSSAPSRSSFLNTPAPAPAPTAPAPAPAPTAAANPTLPPTGLIDGRPASEALIPRALPADPVDAYMADLDAYQSGLSGTAAPGASESAIQRINARYAASSDLDKARMVAAQLKRQSRILRR